MFIMKALYAINKKNISSIDFIYVMHIHWGKNLDAFENQHCSSFNMHIYNLVTDFRILVIPEAIFKLEQSNLVQLEHLTH